VLTKKPDTDTIFNLSLDKINGCTVTKPASDTVKISASLRPIGQQIAINKKEFTIYDNGGCGANDFVSKQVCADDDAMFLKHYVSNPHTSGSPNGNSKIESVTKTTNNRCIDIGYRLKGAGFDILRTCKGSAWIGFSGYIEQKTNIGAKYLLPEETYVYSLPIFCGSKGYSYEGNIPSNVEIDGWKWSATIIKLLPTIPITKKTVNLTSNSPKVDGFEGAFDNKSRTLYIYSDQDCSEGSTTHNAFKPANLNNDLKTQMEIKKNSLTLPPKHQEVFKPNILSKEKIKNNNGQIKENKKLKK
jgi:hypothetical protein